MNHAELNERVRYIGLDASAAECHGVFCGLLCGGHQDPEPLWLDELLADCDPQDLLVMECSDELRALAAATRVDIEGPGMGFSPLLPEDSEPLAERAASLRDWVRGFLYGLGLCGNDSGELSAETLEALADMASISQLDAEGASASEQDEQAYTELGEFIWVAAMLVYEERTRREAVH